MIERELKQILASDMKLWQSAETQYDGGDVVKTIELPYGIGVQEIRFEGAVNDANKKREALGVFGNFVRGLVDEAIGDEAVSARAQSKAALASPPPGGDDGGGTPSVEAKESGETPLREGPVAALDAFDDGPEALANRRDGLVKLHSDYTGRLDSLELQIQAADALIELYNDGSSTHKKTPSGN